MWRRTLLRALAAGILFGVSQSTPAQQVTVGVPTIGVSDSFYENFNIGWGFRWRSPRGSMFFNFPGGSTFPPFGGYNPNADARFGVARQWGNGNFGLVFSGGQGSTRTMTMDSATLTTMNGVPGSIFSGSMRPFVVGVIPVVGDFPLVYYPDMPLNGSSAPVMTSPLAERVERLRYAKQHPQESPDALNLVDEKEAADAAPDTSTSGNASSAQRGDISVAEIRRQQAEGDAVVQREIAKLVDEARGAQRSGSTNVARLRYKQAAAKAAGEQRRELLRQAARLDQIESAP